MSIIKSFFESVNKLGPFERNAQISVAVSGGSDSLALTFLLNEWCKKNNYTLHAITIDHSFRQESAEEANYVQRILERNNIKHRIIKLALDKIRNNKQEKARHARYNSLTDYCKKNNIYHLFTGHTLNDNVESFFLRLMRGSTLMGLEGINKKIIFNDIRVLRPLLNSHRQDLENYLGSLKIKWVSDPSNDDLYYKRNLCRKLLSSQTMLDLSNQDVLKVMFERVNNTIQEIQLSNTLQMNQLSKFFVRNITIFNSGYCSAELSKFLELSEDTSLRVLSKIIHTIGGFYEHEPRKSSLKNIREKILEQNSLKLTLGKTIIKINRPNKKIIFYPEILSNKIQNMDKKILYCERYLAHIGDQNLFSPQKLNKHEAPYLPDTIRKSSFEVTLQTGKKLVPFVSKGYYSVLKVEYAPRASISSKTCS